VNVKSGNSDPNKFVLIFGGGYDPRQENPPYAKDTIGNRIYMVDAKTGSLLWYAGGPGTGAPKLSLDEMNNSIPAPVSVIDSNGDGFADRMYAGDMGGRVWRFDLFNGKEAASLVTGGVLARLGAGVAAATSPGTPAQSTVRRFYNAPDVSLIQQGDDDPYYNVAIGSGYRGHPLNKDTSDAFYSLRDKRPFAQMTTSDWASYKPITESDTGLIDISSNPLGTPIAAADRGWKYHFDSGNKGEKVLAPSTTFNNVVLFNTYQPSDGTSDSCYPTSKNRVYALYASSGKPALDMNKDGEVDNEDVSKTLAFTNGIAGGVTVGVDFSNKVGTTPPGDPTPTTPVTPGAGVPVCRSALEVVECPQGTGANRTFWKRKDAK
jgi:type IV pilus assembly protein PilY1